MRPEYVDKHVVAMNPVRGNDAALRLHVRADCVQPAD